MDRKYFDFYFQLMAWAVLMAFAFMFLSSMADAKTHDVSKPSFFYVFETDAPSLVSGSLVFKRAAEPFDRQHSPVKFILAWPKLPTVAEQQVRLA